MNWPAGMAAEQRRRGGNVRSVLPGVLLSVPLEEGLRGADSTTVKAIPRPAPAPVPTVAAMLASPVPPPSSTVLGNPVGALSPSTTNEDIHHGT